MGFAEHNVNAAPVLVSISSSTDSDMAERRAACVQTAESQAQERARAYGDALDRASATEQELHQRMHAQAEQLQVLQTPASVHSAHLERASPERASQGIRVPAEERRRRNINMRDWWRPDARL